MRSQRWYPDTCLCVFQYSWDDVAGETPEEPSSVQVIAICDQHKQIQEAKEHYRQALRDNREAGERKRAEEKQV